MKHRWILRLLIAVVLGVGSVLPVLAEEKDPTSAEETSSTGFEKPYVGERESLGYDPEGIEYKQNRVEDFQVLLISSAPFAAMFSYVVTGLVSKLERGTFKVDGPYSRAFLIGTVAGAATIATVSVIGPRYTPPPEAALPSPPRTLVHSGWRVPLVEARF